jgi:hypothetical protein
MLSQLPAEVSVEDTVKTQVLGLAPRGDARSASMAAGGASMMMLQGPGGMLFPGGGQGAPGQMLALPMPPGGGFYGGGPGRQPGGPYSGYGDGTVAVNIGSRGGGGGGGGWAGGAPGY